MELEKYTFTTDEGRFSYEFYSEGPKGRIKKAVQFGRFKHLGSETYNLGFGDWNDREERIDDQISTNNGDRDKVLATVGAIVLHFMMKYPHVNIFATGNTKSRNRLYRVGIARVFEEISQLYNIYGYSNGEWLPFQTNSDYDAFLLFSK